jgi:peroxiredoxin
MALQVGKKAPDFALFSDEKKEVKLSDFRGKNVVLNFFPAAFTGVCTAQMCDARDNFQKYSAMNAQVLGISVDSPFTLAKFKETNNLNFPLLSDFNKKTIKKYGLTFEKFPFNMTTVAARAVVVVDKKGTVKYMEVLENPGNPPNFAALRDAVAQLN